MSGNKGTDIWIAGAFAAFTVDLLVYPLDTLKTRIQSPDYRRLYIHESTNTLKKGALFRGLYQGIGSVILATLPSCAFFTTYETTKSLLSPLHTHHNIPTPVLHSTASALSECVSCAILTPAEVIKQNAQMVSRNPSFNPEITRASPTRQVLARFRRNPWALWRGYGALTGRNLPHTALQFPLFEWFREGVVRWRRGREGGPGRGGGGAAGAEETILERTVITSLSAGLAGGIAAVTTTPIDVVKTRIMLSASDTFASQDASPSSKPPSSSSPSLSAHPQASSSAKRQSSLTIARDIVASQGWRGLWRGGALRGVWTMLGSGLYLGIYEGGRVWLERRGGGGGGGNVD